MAKHKVSKPAAWRTAVAMAALGMLAWVAAVPSAHASPESTVWDGIYTPAQAQRGQALYAKQCASCHKDDLQGHGTTPSLAGQDFIEKWDGQSLGDLFEKMQSSMPADHPGSLTREQNAAILAFILSSNQYPAGPADLRTASDWLAGIRITAAKSK